MKVQIWAGMKPEVTTGQMSFVKLQVFQIILLDS
jgi:hypothetical protein